MQAHFKHLLLACEVSLLVRVVDHQVAVVLLLFDALLIDLVLNPVRVTHVICHVCGKDHSYDSLANEFVFI